MGLDQYAYAVRPHSDNTDFGWAWEAHEQDYDSKVHNIAEWRKHSDLQGWMEALYLRKCDEQGVEPRMGAEGSWFEGQVTFNCQPLRLSYQDLLDLREAVNDDALPETEGFFFGQSDDYHKEQTVKFIEDALRAIGQDMTIYYDSWW
jgi:hypothetical protein